MSCDISQAPCMCMCVCVYDERCYASTLGLAFNLPCPSLPGSLPASQRRGSALANHRTKPNGRRVCCHTCREKFCHIQPRSVWVGCLAAPFLLPSLVHACVCTRERKNKHKKKARITGTFRRCPVFMAVSTEVPCGAFCVLIGVCVCE